MLSRPGHIFRKQSLGKTNKGEGRDGLCSTVEEMPLLNLHEKASWSAAQLVAFLKDLQILGNPVP